MNFNRDSIFNVRPALLGQSEKRSNSLIAVRFRRMMTGGSTTRTRTILRLKASFPWVYPAQATIGPVDTGKITTRRKLKFDTTDQVLAEVDRLVEAERAGRAQATSETGPWARRSRIWPRWVEYAYAGYPNKPPFFIVWILRSRKQKFIHDPMRAGVKIPGVPGGTFATEPVPRKNPGRYDACSRAQIGSPDLRSPDLRDAFSRRVDRDQPETRRVTPRVSASDVARASSARMPPSR